MDKFWKDVADFLAQCGVRVGRVAGPGELRKLVPGLVPYAHLMRAPIDEFDAIVIHKGMLPRLGRRLVDSIRSSLHPVFANEVFVVFGRGKVPGEIDQRHVLFLEAMLRRIPDDPPAYAFTLDVADAISELLSLTTGAGQPNVNPLWSALRNLGVLQMNVKLLGYELARAQRQLTPERRVDEPLPVGLRSKASTQADIDSEWLWHWAQQLRRPAVYHRKMWEYCYVLQALFDAGCLRQGASGIGFGCGTEPLPSFFASRGIDVTLTDLPPDDARAGVWADTQQHAASLESCRDGLLADSKTFLERASLAYVDMNRIPPNLAGRYDFCWSICALEHLGSIAAGLDFIENSLSVLKPGGLAVHTTEYSYLERARIDNWPTVYFERDDLTSIAERLTSAGHEVAPLDFAPGSAPMDVFVDVPPFSSDLDYPSEQMLPLPGAGWSVEQHLKFSIDGVPSTCFGLIVRKAGSV